ncbi:MAG: bifunctional aldolase/short-chain dehydrogenase [Chloroflexi bacterium]|nr:bifunctional aldolase/short-chain dehydrogenase [Chloroflexota bacterium]
MDSRWDGKRAAGYGDDLLALRAYSSRLLGANSDLVLHGGGNTSVKIDGVDLHGEPQRLLYVKGSGWDLASIEPAGFAPLRIEPVRRLAELESLSDSDMMRSLRSASVDPDAPAPSVETITHALVPHRFVDHTHADAVVTISNTSDGADRLRDLYGDEVLVVPYAMPGFVLARLIADLTAGVDWASLRGMVLMNHGVFTFAGDARASYEAMIEIVSRAEAAVAGSLHAVAKSSSSSDEGDLLKLATLRRAVSEAAGKAMIARLNDSDGAVGFAGRRDAGELAGRGCLTPDHVLHTKPSPVVVGDEPAADVAEFGRQYEAYFSRNAGPEHTQLDPAPRWAIWPGAGIVGFGPTAGRAGIVVDITAQAIRAMQAAEELGRWNPPGEKDLFDVEYWELEQAKLKRGGPGPPLQGKIALVTGAASGIGRACAEVLLAQGAAVAALDVNPAVIELFDSIAAAGFVCDVTDSRAVDAAVDGAVRRFGGLDIVVANAGTFPPGVSIDELDDETWSAVIDVNLTGHMRVLRAAAPYLRLGIDAAVVVIASKNVAAPGPGAAAYSAAKAGLTQLARVAALEFGPAGIRVNVIHPNAVFDTGIWTDEVLQNRADHYGITVDEYRRNNVLGVEVESRDVAELAAAMAGPLFGRTTGAQVPVDGGNERVI